MAKPKTVSPPAKKPAPKKSPVVPPIHPRERMTVKAKRAIQEYVQARLGEMMLLHLAIDYTPVGEEGITRPRLEMRYEVIETYS